MLLWKDNPSRGSLQGALEKYRAARCIYSGYTLRLDDNKSDLTPFCVLVYTHTATCPTGIWATSVWHKMPSAEAGVAEPKKR